MLIMEMIDRCKIWISVFAGFPRLSKCRSALLKGVCRDVHSQSDLHGEFLEFQVACQKYPSPATGNPQMSPTNQPTGHSSSTLQEQEDAAD